MCDNFFLTLDKTCEMRSSMKKFFRAMRGTQGALIIAWTIQIIFGFNGLCRSVVRLV
uniref:Uncharacterized protein n=1 Tax=Arundo donax TaxID=35708 RepID=A0A0A9HJ08_ARUDO